MAAVSQRIDNYLGGVSKQSDSKKLPGQVKECLNAFPQSEDEIGYWGNLWLGVVSHRVRYH